MARSSTSRRAQTTSPLGDAKKSRKSSRRAASVTSTTPVRRSSRLNPVDASNVADTSPSLKNKAPSPPPRLDFIPEADDVSFSQQVAELSDYGSDDFPGVSVDKGKGKAKEIDLFNDLPPSDLPLSDLPPSDLPPHELSSDDMFMHLRTQATNDEHAQSLAECSSRHANRPISEIAADLDSISAHGITAAPTSRRTAVPSLSQTGPMRSRSSRHSFRFDPRNFSYPRTPSRDNTGLMGHYEQLEKDYEPVLRQQNDEFISRFNVPSLPFVEEEDFDKHLETPASQKGFANFNSALVLASVEGPYTYHNRLPYSPVEYSPKEKDEDDTTYRGIRVDASLPPFMRAASVKLTHLRQQRGDLQRMRRLSNRYKKLARDLSSECDKLEYDQTRQTCFWMYWQANNRTERYHNKILVQDDGKWTASQIWNTWDLAGKGWVRDKERDTYHLEDVPH